MPDRAGPASRDRKKEARLPMNKIAIPALFLILTMGLLGSGCRVHTGEMILPDHPQTISVPIVKNKTFEYGAEERLTDILIQELIRDGRLRVVSEGRADLELQAVLTRYDLKKVSLDRDEQAVVFNLDTAVTATLKDLRSGEVLYQDRKFEESGVFFLSNQPQTRREEQIYVRLAEAMISQMLEGW
jgi:hypothetical protein